MSRAYIVKRKNKEYVKAECDICGKENYFSIDQVKPVFLYGYDLHCKYCGSKITITVYGSKLESRIKAWKRSVMRKKGLI